MQKILEDRVNLVGGNGGNRIDVDVEKIVSDNSEAPLRSQRVEEKTSVDVAFVAFVSKRVQGDFEMVNPFLNGGVSRAATIAPRYVQVSGIAGRDRSHRRGSSS